MKHAIASFAAVIALLFAAPLAFANGGTRVVMVAYHSNPEGAKIVSADGVIGIAPFVTWYEVTEAFLAGECMPVGGLGAIWITGAHVIQRSLKICPQNGTIRQVVKFTLPPGESNSYISAFAHDPQLLQTARNVDDFMRGGDLLTRDLDQAALAQAYQHAEDEAHEDLGRRIAAAKERIRLLDGAIQAQQHQSAMESAIREDRNEDAIYDAVGNFQPPYARPSIIQYPASPPPQPSVTCTTTPTGDFSGTIKTICH